MDIASEMFCSYVEDTALYELGWVGGKELTRHFNIVSTGALMVLEYHKTVIFIEVK